MFMKPYLLECTVETCNKRMERRDKVEKLLHRNSQDLRPHFSCAAYSNVMGTSV